MRAVGASPPRLHAVLTGRRKDFYDYCMSKQGSTTLAFMQEACATEASRLGPGAIALRRYRGPLIAAGVFGAGLVAILATRKR